MNDLVIQESPKEQLTKLRNMKEKFLSLDVWNLDMWKHIKRTESLLEKKINQENKK